ncbi:transketolase [Streptomyces sp. NPDC015171]|uniref:transketolase n=1 Tax=Streptomyces sp. NPDC015171 TaxID=3364945 RepID=UPI003702B8F2
MSAHPERAAALARRLRRDVVEMAAGPQGAHLGGSLSCVDVLAVLYGGLLGDQDTFVLSKGHAAPALYAALAATGRIDRAELSRYAEPGSRLFGHPPRGLPGVEFPTGSLGHGLSLAAGVALAGQLTGAGGRTYALLGDGELQEGSVWEAALFAASRRLTSLVAVVDRNGLQLARPTEEAAGAESLEARFTAFGWQVRAVDGHDHAALGAALGDPADRPVAVLARTVKGHGVPFLQGRVASHYVRLRPDLLKRALAALDAQERR